MGFIRSCLNVYCRDPPAGEEDDEGGHGEEGGGFREDEEPEFVQRGRRRDVQSLQPQSSQGKHPVLHMSLRRAVSRLPLSKLFNPQQRVFCPDHEAHCTHRHVYGFLKFNGFLKAWDIIKLCKTSNTSQRESKDVSCRNDLLMATSLAKIQLLEVEMK